MVDDADDANIDDPMPADLPKKQKFKNLDKVLDEDNYVDLRPKENVHSSMQTPKII